MSQNLNTFQSIVDHCLQPAGVMPVLLWAVNLEELNVEQQDRELARKRLMLIRPEASTCPKFLVDSCRDLLAGTEVGIELTRVGIFDHLIAKLENIEYFWTQLFPQPVATGAPL